MYFFLRGINWELDKEALKLCVFWEKWVEVTHSLMQGTIFNMSPCVTHLNMGGGGDVYTQQRKQQWRAAEGSQQLPALCPNIPSYCSLFRNQLRGNSGKASDMSVFWSCEVLLFHFSIFYWHESVALFWLNFTEVRATLVLRMKPEDMPGPVPVVGPRYVVKQPAGL